MRHVNPTFAAVALAKQGGRNNFAIVDVGDLTLVQRFGPWHVSQVNQHRYALTVWETKGFRVHITMHALILGPPPGPGLRIQHRNGNGFDNRRENIRYATQDVILAGRKPTGGRSKYKGVAWDDDKRKWTAVFRGKKLGRFHDEVDAAEAFDRAAWNQWGPDAYLNFPEKIDTSRWGICGYCGDHTEYGEDPRFDLCAMCETAGRG